MACPAVTTSDPRITDLGSFRAAQRFAPLPKGEFRKVRKLSDGIHGDIVLHQWTRESQQELVVVKLLQNDRLATVWDTERDEHSFHTDVTKKSPHAEDALTEIGILMHLSRQADAPESLLSMQGVFGEGAFTWLVTEYCEGGELFEQAVACAVDEPQLRVYITDLLQAVTYLHRHSIGHRDISLENILLKDGKIKLMDFGMSVRSHSSSGTSLRYFRAVGKDFYRAPECYVPRATQVEVHMPDDAKCGDVILAQTTWRNDVYLCEVRLPSHAAPGQKVCKADVWGYATGPADVWSLGVCFFILAFQCPPWNQAMLDDDAFAYVHAFGADSVDCGLEAVLKSWGKQPLSKESMQFLKDVLNPDPALRPSAYECLQRQLTHELANTQNEIVNTVELDSASFSCAEVGGA